MSDEGGEVLDWVPTTVKGRKVRGVGQERSWGLHIGPAPQSWSQNHLIRGTNFSLSFPVPIRPDLHRGDMGQTAELAGTRYVQFTQKGWDRVRRKLVSDLKVIKINCHQLIMRMMKIYWIWRTWRMFKKVENVWLEKGKTTSSHGSRKEKLKLKVYVFSKLKRKLTVTRIYFQLTRPSSGVQSWNE